MAWFFHILGMTSSQLTNSDCIPHDMGPMGATVILQIDPLVFTKCSWNPPWNSITWWNEGWICSRDSFHEFIWIPSFCDQCSLMFYQAAINFLCIFPWFWRYNQPQSVDGDFLGLFTVWSIARTGFRAALFCWVWPVSLGQFLARQRRCDVDYSCGKANKNHAQMVGGSWVYHTNQMRIL